MPKKSRTGDTRVPNSAAILAAVLLSFGGLTGVADLIARFQDPKPEAQSCADYWASIGELERNGFSGFELMSPGEELSDRCGSPSEVADDWPDPVTQKKPQEIGKE